MALNAYQDMQISNSKSFSNSQILVVTFNSISSLSSSPLTKEQLKDLRSRTNTGEANIHFWHKGQHILCEKLEKSTSSSDLEKTRIIAHKAMQFCLDKKAQEVAVFSTIENEEVNAAFMEGLTLAITPSINTFLKATKSPKYNASDQLTVP